MFSKQLANYIKLAPGYVICGAAALLAALLAAAALQGVARQPMVTEESLAE